MQDILSSLRPFPSSGEIRSVNTARRVMIRAALDNVGTFFYHGEPRLVGKSGFVLDSRG